MPVRSNVRQIRNHLMTSLLDTEIPQPFSTDEAFETFLKEECSFLAKGSSREVYQVRDGKSVVKVAVDRTNPVCNWTEIVAFLKFESDRDKLACIRSWSSSGSFLVMERVDMASGSNRPFDYPSWVTDRKPSNIGKCSNGSFKICDYALIKSPDSAYKSEFA